MAGDCGPMPCLCCRKMCCLNSSRKLHFVQKIRLDRNIKNLGPEGFFARCAIFCRYWTCSFSGRNNQAIGAEVVCHFLLFVSMSFVISRFCFRFVEMVAAKILHNCELSK